MRVFFIAIFFMLVNASFLHSEEPSFKFTFGSNLGKIPFEINKTSKNLKKSPGIKINSWILSPNFSSFSGINKSSNFAKKENFSKNDFSEKIYIKFNYKF